MKLSAHFRDACEDYRYLLDRGYPSKSALDMVGNHYQLSRDERLMLFRGIRSTASVVETEQRLLELPLCAAKNSTPVQTQVQIAGTLLSRSSLSLIIDGYNVLGTILSYLLGRMLFIANDGIIRDIGAFHGKFSKNASLFENAMHALAKTCMTYFGECMHKIYLDEPVSESAAHKLQLLSIFQKLNSNIQVIIIPSADFGLINSHEGILCTSDSVIIDATKEMLLDLPRLVLHHNFDAQITHIDTL